MPHVAPFSLGDLLDQHEFGLMQLTGPPDARDRRVSGVHSIEISHPARWLAPDWVMLTTGVRLRGRPQEQRQLVTELAENGVTALGFALDVVFKTAPQPLIEQAAKLDFPVFGVPLQTPFRDVTAFVQRSLLSSEMRALQRLSSIQHFLIEALQSQDPQTAVVQRLSTLLDASVAILGPRGRVEKAIGELPDDVAAVLGEPAAGVREIALESGWWAVAAPIVSDQPATQPRWVLAAHRHHGFINRLTKPSLQATAPLLAAIGRLQDALVEQDNALRAALLEELLHQDGHDPVELGARAEAFGLSIDEPHAMIVLGSPDHDGAVADALAHGLGERLELRGIAHVLGRDSGCVVALLPPVRDELAAAVRSLVEAHPTFVTCGVGRTVSRICELPSSGADAHVAQAVAAEHGVRWQRYEDLDLPTLVVGHVAAERIEPAVREVLKTLDERRGTREALEAWFAHDLDVTAASAALNLHPNSLRYRLSRLSESLGRPLRAPETIATLHLALQLERRLDAGRGE